MKNSLQVMRHRYNYHVSGGHVYPTFSAHSDNPSKPLISMWKAYVLKHNPTMRPALAHRIAFEIVNRPAHITYQTAYAYAIADFGVQS